MRGHRLLFVLALLFALGLIGFANFPSDRDAVPDAEASRLVGGQLCIKAYTSVNCTQPPCMAASMFQLFGGGLTGCATTTYCGGGGNGCGLNYNACGGG